MHYPNVFNTGVVIMLNLKELVKIREETIVKLLMIVGLLWNKEMYEGEIKGQLGLKSYPLISKYLSILKKTGIIRVTRID